jgi:membrane-anchored glycerophosphoryl diester phosphodiesterase (GDPDase)
MIQEIMFAICVALFIMCFLLCIVTFYLAFLLSQWMAQHNITHESIISFHKLITNRMNNIEQNHNLEKTFEKMNGVETNGKRRKNNN